MTDTFFKHPILNSPYEYPSRHWELDDEGQPTEKILELTPDLVGPSITRNEGIVGEGVDLNLQHTRDMRRSTLFYQLTKRLLYIKWRDTDDQPKLYLFSQLKRIVRQWLDECLICKGDTYPAQLMYQELADMACERITAAIMEPLVAEEKPVVALLDRYNPEGSTRYVNFYTSKKTRWETDSRRCHVNWAVCDSDWEAELCRVLEAHPKVLAYVKNQGLGFEVPYRYGSVTRRYRPDFIVVVAAGSSTLNLVVEVKGYRGEDAKEKKNAMDAYWVPGVNNLAQYGHWAFAELRDVYQMEVDLAAEVENALGEAIDGLTDETG